MKKFKVVKTEGPFEKGDVFVENDNGTFSFEYDTKESGFTYNCVVKLSADFVKNAVEKGLVYAYRDRRQKKRNFRALWIQRINAGARLHGLSYSKFMGAIHKAGIELNRKVLADLAMNNPEAFKAIVEKVK